MNGLSVALRGYVADRLHLAAANLDDEEVRFELRSLIRQSLKPGHKASAASKRP